MNETEHRDEEFQKEKETQTAASSTHTSETEALIVPSNEILPVKDVLNLSSCNLIEVPNTVISCKYLRELNLSNNSLESLPKKITLFNLVVLNLSNNNLSSLPLSLKHCHQLSYLNLSHNKFFEVPDVLFCGLRNIQVLDMSYNEIWEFSKAPECVVNIVELYCSNNLLEKFPKWVLSCICNLKKVDLSQNGTNFSYEPVLCYVSTGVFESLQYLNIENCNYVCDGNEFLSCFINVKVLNIGNVVDMSKGNLGKNFLGNFKMSVLKNYNELEVLDIKNSQFSIIPEGFEKLKNLKFLKASHNLLSWLPESFCNLTNLSILDLSFNQILFLPNDINKLHNLKELHLSYNKLSELPESLSQLTNLEFFDVYNNKIKNLDIAILKCENIQGIDFDMNFINFTKMNTSQSLTTIQAQYDSLKNTFRKKFNYTEKRCDIQLKPNDNYLPVSCQSSPYSSSRHSSGCEDLSSELDEIAENVGNVENKETDDDWGSTSANEDDLFDPHKVSPYKYRSNVFLSSVLDNNYCPASAHLQSVVRSNRCAVCSKNEKVEDGQFDSE